MGRPPLARLLHRTMTTDPGGGGPPACGLGGAVVVALRVLVLGQDPDRAAAVETQLAEAGCRLAGRVERLAELADRARAGAPDAIVLALARPSREALAAVRRVGEETPLPVVVFVDASDEAATAEAIKAGVSAYIVDGLNDKRLKPILDVALARFREVQALREELVKTKASLHERKIIERAKGILMKQRGMDEDEAYRTLRALAMGQNKRLAEVAEYIVGMADLLLPSANGRGPAAGRGGRPQK